MNRFGMVILLAATIPACDHGREVGDRYRSDRALWKANARYQSLSVRPDLVSEDTWRELASTYEAIGVTFADAAAGSSPEAEDVGRTTAQALYAAAQLHAQLGDTTIAESTLLGMRESHARFDGVQAQVASGLGALHERRGHWAEAADYYDEAVAWMLEVPPSDQRRALGPDLPLRAARLRAQSVEDVSGAAPHYEVARSYYEAVARDHAGTRYETLARSYLADVAADLQDWKGADEQLRLLEQQAAGGEKPDEAGAAVARLRRARIERQAGVPADSVSALLESLADDYERSGAAVQALLDLAVLAQEEGDMVGAIAYLDRIHKEYGANDVVGSNALLAKARLLASEAGRGKEALDTYRFLAAEYPLTDAGIQVPLEIVRYHVQQGDSLAARRALTQAEREYRDHIDRYQSGQLVDGVRARLVETLIGLEEFDVAINEIERLANRIENTTAATQLLLAGARIAERELGEEQRALTFLERAVEVANGEALTWASAEAARLRAQMGTAP